MTLKKTARSALARGLSRTLAWACVGLLLGSSTVAVNARQHVPPEGPNDSELQLLPEICKVRLRESADAWKPWQAQIGPKNYSHVHHYCFALNYIHRARMTVDKRRKRYFLQRSEANFNYVLERWDKDLPLRAEAEAGKRQVQLMLRLL